MKSSVYLALSILCFALYSFTNSTTVPDTAINLEEAVKKGLIKINVTGMGGHSGDCLNAKIQNISPGKIALKIPAGTLFKPGDTSMQDIILTRGYMIDLERNSVKSQKLTGFCCKASNRCPSAGIDFKMGKVVNARLVEIATYLSKNNYDENTIQGAVWCISNAHSVSEIYDEDMQKVKPLREEICRLTGQKDNWYSINTNRIVDERGYIQTEPVKVTGTISVNVDKPAPIYQGVYKENGEEAIANRMVFDIARTGLLAYKFALEVKGWEKGNYYVKVTMSGKEVLKQQFTI